MSTTKLITAGVAGVVLLLGIAFYAYHKTHDLPPGAVWQAPPAYQGAPPSQLLWQAPPASDPASRQAQQQIMAQLGQFTSGLSAGDLNKVMAVYNPDLADPGGYGFKNGQRVQMPTQHYSDVSRSMSGLIAHHGKLSVYGTVTSCVVTGDTAQVLFGGGTGDFRNRGMLHIVAPKTYALWGAMAFVKRDGQWLIN